MKKANCTKANVIKSFLGGDWISIKERKPKFGKQVLVYCGRHSVYDISYYWGKNWRKNNRLRHLELSELGFEIADVTHWMMLPKPPKNVL